MAFYFNITFVKKYLYGFTSEKEEAELLNNFEINGKMAEVWDNFSDLKSREIHPDTDKIFQVIRTQANIPDKQIYRLNSQDAKRKWYNHNLAIAASLIFMMLLGTIAFYVYQKYDLNSYITVVSEKGQRKEFTLPDGSRVWLNADTKIKYKKHFNSPVREVVLNGEAYFSVVKDTARPFIVKTSKLDIKVLGTVFNVKSYPGDKTIETTLVTGLVSIEKNTGRETEKDAPVLVKPQQKAIFSLTAEQIKVESVNVDKTTSWKNGKLVFDNESIDAVLAKLQRWYGVKVALIGKNKFTEDRYTLTIKDENIEEVIHLLQYTSRITFKVEDLDGTHERVYEPSNTENNELVE
jgi:ferric-dicitrate binding protein FerR (iron transport regulator)